MDIKNRTTTDTFQNRLRQGLEMRNLSAAALSRRSGVEKSQISNYLAGHYEAKQTALHQLALALNVSESWLMGLDVSSERQHPSSSEISSGLDGLFKKLIRLDTIDRAKIEEQIDFLLDNNKYLSRRN